MIGVCVTHFACAAKLIAKKPIQFVSFKKVKRKNFFPEFYLLERGTLEAEQFSTKIHTIKKIISA